MSSGTGKVVVGLLAGLAVGALLGVLFAPDKGSETRRKMAEKGSDLADDVNEKLKKLIDELLTLDNPYNCPHGRPTIISMSKYEIQKKFKRIVT